MDRQVHIDLESLGTHPLAQLLSIGAVFEAKQFYVEIDVAGYNNTAFTTDADTIAWWERQGGFQSQGPVVSPYQAVTSLTQWFHEVTAHAGDVSVWAVGPQFDLIALREHMQAFTLQCPWNYWQEADVRTVKRLARGLHLNVKEYAKPHHALQDAIAQRDYVVRVYDTLVDHVQLANESRLRHPTLQI